jgi:hypothetical protein
MPAIIYNATNFPLSYGPSLAGQHSLNVSWPELVWAAISVGKGQFQHLVQYGVFSGFEIAYRVAILYANLQETPQGGLRRSSAYDGLDPSEKGAISYFIGLTMAKLLAGQLLSVPWLMHMDVYRQQLAPILAGNSRPDLVGLTTGGGWVVVEAKGRTHGFDNSALQAAKNQTAQLTTIQGVAPVLRVGALAFFGAAGTLEVAIDDPRSRPARVPDLPLSAGLIWDSYYRPFQAWIRDAGTAKKETLGTVPYSVAPLPHLDLWVGLPDRLFQNGTLVLQSHGQQRSNEFIGPDGLFVRLGSAWSDKNMTLEPQERQNN